MAVKKKQESAGSVSSSAPIGIFDSGIGGLTVANAIKSILPNESLIYFGDTAHLPYGEKSPDLIKKFSLSISDFLIRRKCKMIVIACNTASSVAFDAVKKFAGKNIITVNVIDPVVDEVSTEFNKCKVGVIGTKTTIRSKVYLDKIRKKNPTLEIHSMATPLLAPMIEEGFFNNNISRTIINSYLSQFRLKDISALILACTHYPLIRPEIEEFYRKKTRILDSASIVAHFVKKELKEKNLLNKQKKASHKFYVSDLTPSFELSTKLFFKKKINLEHFPMWNKK